MHVDANRGSRSTLPEMDKAVEIREAKNRVITPVRRADPGLDCCDQLFVCRMAKKLGCRFCADESAVVSASVQTSKT